MRRSNQQRTLIVGVIAALAGFALVALYMSGGRSNAPATQNAPAAVEQSADTTARATPAQSSTRADAPAANTAANTNAVQDDVTAPQTPMASRAQQQEDGGNSIIETLFGTSDVSANASPRAHWMILVPRIIIRLALAALLVAALAFRPRRRGVAVLQRNPYVAQTQILLAVVASALMMIVGDSAARAFGIFAAASLVRFRTNIRDPKEITVLLISLAIGLATGVGRWELALTLAIFVFPLLWVLEHYAYNQVMRAMQVTVKTRDLLQTQATLINIFRRRGFAAEIRQLEPPTEDDPVGCVVYSLNMNLGVSTDELSEEINSAHPENIQGIEWEQKKNTGYIYQ
ncbi:MAG TPA: DUF4956 domain-containing protein [Pyrinomonadaceae bacterium]|jgi:hypothetical protein|nr:DUF4956 domain-containing protein [Pyrinomonadaceae bacterium]